MSKQQFSIEIHKPVNEVFEFTTNPNNTPKWLEFIAEEQIDKKPIAIGTTYRNKKIGEDWTEYTVTEYEENKAFTLKQKNSTYHVRYTYIPSDDGKSTMLVYLEWAEEGGIKEPFTKDLLQKLKEVMEQDLPTK